MLLFIGEVASIFYRAYFFLCFLDSLFSLLLWCVCLLSTFCLGRLCQYVTKKGKNRWNLKSFLAIFMGRWNCFLKGEKIKVFDISNLGGELVCFSLLLMLYLLFIFFICLYFHTYGDVLFWVFQERQVHSDQDLRPLLATFRFEVINWDLWCNWTFYSNWVILVFEHFILYVSFVTDGQRGRLLSSKSLEQLPNREHKLV